MITLEQKQLFNSIVGVCRREILRYLRQPEQTIINEIFASFLFWFLLYLLKPEGYLSFLTGTLFVSSFKVIFSNLKMSIFVGRLEHCLDYQLATAIPKQLLYFIYCATSILRSILIIGVLLLIFSCFSTLGTVKQLLSLLAWLLLADLFFANVSILCNLSANSWNKIGAIDSYMITPLLYLSGCFCSWQGIKEPINTLIYFNPIFHFYNVGIYLLSGGTLFPLTYSIALSLSLVSVSTFLGLYAFRKGYGLIE